MGFTLFEQFLIIALLLAVLFILIPHFIRTCTRATAYAYFEAKYFHLSKFLKDHKKGLHNEENDKENLTPTNEQN